MAITTKKVPIEILYERFVKKPFGDYIDDMITLNELSESSNNAYFKKITKRICKCYFQHVLQTNFGFVRSKRDNPINNFKTAKNQLMSKFDELLRLSLKGKITEQEYIDLCNHIKKLYENIDHFIEYWEIGVSIQIKYLSINNSKTDWMEQFIDSYRQKTNQVIFRLPYEASVI